MIRDTVTTGVVRQRTLSRNGITRLRQFLIGFVVFLLVGTRVQASPPAQDVDPEALDALYNLDFDKAEESFRLLTVREPDNPTAWNMLASSIWLKIVYEQEKLNLDSFTGSRLGGEDSNELVSQERERYLRETIDHAITAAQAVLDRNPKDLEALYAMGVSYATLASFEALARKAYFAAHGDAKEAREYHMEVLQLDPSFNDARLTVGTYDYAVGVIPRFLRWMLAPFGIRGDKEEGIEQLEYAARLGDRAETNAKMVLAVVYNREKRYEEALAILEDLHSSYPRNYLLEVSIASVYEKMDMWPEAIATYRSVLRKMEAGTDGYDRFESEPVLFKLAEAHVHSHRGDESIPMFEEIIADADSSDALKARAHLWLGRLFRDAGQKEKARAHFEAILKLDSPDFAREEARKNL